MKHALATIALPKLLALITLLAAAGALLYFAALPPAGAQTIVDYDADDNGLIEVSSLAQLDAMRWDVDGNGVPSAPTGTPVYNAAFPNRDTATSTRMGCPSGTCTGYELTADLTFPSESGPLNPWTPIPPFWDATFDGNGHTISDVNVDGGSRAALFAELGGTGIIRNVGLINPNIRGTDAGGVAGGLVGAA